MALFSDPYLKTIERMEPEITPVDLQAAAASIAISLVRIAQALEMQNETLSRINENIWRGNK